MEHRLKFGLIGIVGVLVLLAISASVVKSPTLKTVKPPSLNIVNQKASSITLTNGAISPFTTINWTDRVIDYNTSFVFKDQNDSDWVLQEGMQVIFKFNFDDNEHVEFGFKKTGGTSIVLHDGVVAGKGEIFTPDEEITGSFYIWNKSAANLWARNIEMSF